jgi:sugar phosphate isomerase/epimerase|tara:strand:- start:3049 stop:4008 length:960 start_codon:yes stop_codon:yes gene_type:complete
MKTNNITLNFLLLIFILGFVSCKNENKQTVTNKDSFFKTSLAQWSIHKSIREDGLSPYEFAKIAHELGFEGLEYVNALYSDVTNSEDKASAMEEFITRNNDLAAKYNLKNVLIMIDGEGDLASSNPEERMIAVENHKLWIDAASKMNCSAIRINLKGEKEIENWIKYSVESFGALGEYAKPLNINVIVENHGGLSSNASLLMKVINQVNLENCGTLPDFGNFCMSEGYGSLKENNCKDLYDPYLGISEMLPKAFGLSAKSYAFDSNGDETSLDYYRLLSIAKDAGYNGFIGVEYEGNILSEKDGIIATKKLLEKAAKML